MPKFKSILIFWMCLKLTKISISNINQVLPSLKTYQAKLYFNKLVYLKVENAAFEQYAQYVLFVFVMNWR